MKFARYHPRFDFCEFYTCHSACNPLLYRTMEVVFHGQRHENWLPQKYTV